MAADPAVVAVTKKLTLKGKGPFTVFAPVNAAFTALHPGTLDEYVSGVDRASLSRFVACHVIPGRVDMAAAQDLADLTQASDD